MNELCHLLDWDTAFFEFRIARVAAEALDPGLVEGIDQWCRQNQIQCLYFLARADDPQTSRLAEDHGYRWVDVRLTFENDLAGIQNASVTRLAHPDDLPALKTIARTSYRDSRYYFDSQFPRQKCDEFYETWTARSCEGYADATLVIDFDNVPAGYVTCHLDRDTMAGKIGLVGVSAEAQGQGVGQALVGSSLAWFAEREARTVTVVTQGRNVAAQRLYQRCGFLTSAIQLWYHKWFA